MAKYKSGGFGGENIENFYRKMDKIASWESELSFVYIC